MSDKINHTLVVTKELGESPTLEEFEKEAIKLALTATHWNKRAAALRLGIARSTLLAKIRKYELAAA